MLDPKDWPKSTETYAVNIKKPKVDKKKVKLPVDKSIPLMLVLKRSLIKLKKGTKMSSTSTTKSKNPKERLRIVAAVIGLAGLSFLAFQGAQVYITRGKLQEAFAIILVSALLYMILGVFL